MLISLNMFCLSYNKLLPLYVESTWSFLCIFLYGSLAFGYIMSRVDTAADAPNVGAAALNIHK